MNFGWLLLKHQNRVADRDLVAVAQNLFCYWHAIDERSVLASEITQDELFGLIYKQAVATRQSTIGHPKVVRRISANRNFFFGQGDGCVLKRPSNAEESGTHVAPTHVFSTVPLRLHVTALTVRLA